MIVSDRCNAASVVVFFFKQKTAYEMRISDWSSDVCSSDLYSVSNKSYAGFGEANLHFTERFRGTLGGRVTRDELTYSFARTSTSPTPVTGIQTAFTAVGNTSNTGFSGRAGVQYDLTPKAMAYFTYGRGYKGPA